MTKNNFHKLIVHIDMNSYFATLEQQANPSLRGKAVGVAGKGRTERTVVAAASKEAKVYGVKSGMGIWEARRLCPHIQIVQADYSCYQDASRRIIKILESKTPNVEVFSIDEAFLDFSDRTIAQALKDCQDTKTQIKKEIGEYVTCSVGIAPSKVLAKLASESKKPDGLVVIKPQDSQNFLTSRKLEDLCGIGPRMLKHLSRLGIYSVIGLQQTPFNRLRDYFGVVGAYHLKNLSYGRDSTQVESFYDPLEEKSFSHSYTLPNDMQQDEIEGVLLKLAEKVGRRMRNAGYVGCVVTVWLRFSDLTHFSRQRKISHYICCGLEIYRIALSISEENPYHKPIRALGVRVSQVNQAIYTPLYLFPKLFYSEKIAKMIDKINDKWGEFTIFRAKMFDAKSSVQNIPDGRSKKFIL